MIEFTTNAKYVCVLYSLGGAYAPSISGLNQWYRLVLPVFLHNNIWHLVYNMIAQLTYCISLEETLGLQKFILVYFGTGIMGNLLSCSINHTNVSIGASTSLFGAIGFECVYVFENYDDLGPRRRNYAAMLFMYAFSGLNHGDAHTDSWGHMGGFIGGILISTLFLKHDNYGSISRGKLKAIAFTLLLAFFAITIGELVSLNSSEIRGQARGMEKKCKL